MSTCDRSGLNFENKTSFDMSIVGVDLELGTVQDLHVGQIIKPGGTASGRAYSGSGTGGKAAGRLSIQVNGEGDVAQLSYSFGTGWSTGTGKCSASADGANFSSGGKKYTAVVSTTDSGFDNKKAAVLWVVVSS